MENKTIEELETRKAEIATAMEVDGADLDALEAEARSITEELETRKAAAAQKEEIRKMVAEGAGNVIKDHNEEKENHIMTLDEIRKSPEYINAYAEYIKTGKADECRALIKTENASGKVPVPVLVDDIVRHAWDNDQLLARVRKTAFRGNLKVSFEISASGAVVHTEGTSAPSEEDLTLGIVTMIPANIKKWIRVPDEVVTMGGEAFIRYIYEELTYQIIKKLADLIVADIAATDGSGSATVPAQAVITEAPGLTTIANAYANLSDEATDVCIIMNKLTYAAFVAAQAAGNFSFDPFMGLPVVYNNSLPAYSAASATNVYAIVGDLKGAQVNYPEGEGVALKYDDLTEAQADLVKIVGRQYVAHAVTAPKRFCTVKKPSATT